MYLDWTLRNSEDTETAVEYFTGHSIQGTILSCCTIFIWETCSSERLKKRIIDTYFFILFSSVLEMKNSICLLSVFH